MAKLVHIKNIHWPGEDLESKDWIEIDEAMSKNPDTVTILLANPTDISIPLPDLNGCQIEFSVNTQSSLAMMCFNNFQSIEPYEQIFLGHVLLEDSSLLVGLNTLEASLPSGHLAASIPEITRF